MLGTFGLKQETLTEGDWEVLVLVSSLPIMPLVCREDVRTASVTAVGDVTCLVIDRE